MQIVMINMGPCQLLFQQCLELAAGVYHDLASMHKVFKKIGQNVDTRLYKLLKALNQCSSLNLILILSSIFDSFYDIKLWQTYSNLTGNTTKVLAPFILSNKMRLLCFTTIFFQSTALKPWALSENFKISVFKVNGPFQQMQPF